MTARGNGLRASAYSILIEIEDSLGDRLLSALAESHIAAYVVPAAGPAGTTRLIVHVDAQRRVPAGIVLAGLTPALAGELPADVEPSTESAGGSASSAEALASDAVFAELVAGFHRVPTERTWPDAEDLPADPPASHPVPPSITVLPFDPKSDIDRRRPPGSARGRPPVPLAKEPVSAPEPPDEEDHYEPPALPRLDPPPAPTRWALVGMAFGLALLLFPTLLTFDHTTALDVVGVLCVLASTGVLISRLRDRSPDDPDDGAVV